MPDILLSTLNATYQHASIGLRYLYANMGELQPRTRLYEFTIAQHTRDIAENILALSPKILGLGVYIWNTEKSLELVRILKKVRPELTIIIGGPEVSYECEQQEICQWADYTLRGEGDLVFAETCKSLLKGDKPLVTGGLTPLPNLSQIQLPYSHYLDEDIKNRVIYVEASRGCAFKCEFCLSSLDSKVRTFPLEKFLSEMGTLIERGVREFKFVDRTFNLSIPTSLAILDFFLGHIEKGLFLHFEMIPDRLPPELKNTIQKFPEGSLQFEVGIQTWDPDVSDRISRRQDYSRVIDNLSFLRRETKVHLHTDLIVGLPGETLESFRSGFDALAALDPHEIQIGILKRLRGTPIIRHNKEWEMVYDTQSPYTILQTKTMAFETIQKMVRFAKFWNSYANSGNFIQTIERIKLISQQREDRSLFKEFWEFSEFLNERHPQRYAIALVNLVESAWLFYSRKDPEGFRETLIQDYCYRVKRDIPEFFGGQPRTTARVRKPKISRQELHQRIH